MGGGPPPPETEGAADDQVLPSGSVAVWPAVSGSVTPRTAARQAPLSMGLSRAEHCGGGPFPPPGVFPTQGWDLVSHTAGVVFTS